MTLEGTIRFRDAATRTVTVDGVDIVYREFGTADGLPLVVLNHLAANLDDGDPRVLDGLAADRRVVLLGHRGVGRSGGQVRGSIEEMAGDVISALAALGLHRIDLFGMSMGGMVAQEVVAQAPELVERLILSSSGPAGGPHLAKMTGVMVGGIARGAITFTNPRTYLFFTRTAGGKKAARAYLARLTERTGDRDAAISPTVLRAQISAVHRWGLRPLVTTSPFAGPVLLLHGQNDRVVPIANASALRRIFPDADLAVFDDSGHGVVSQNALDIVVRARDFLRR
ncbi:alpha/beta fold hydrolase [Microbacterium sp. cx-59]|uniref:alpha/beta fold hydrolase n=1 Tax=Microbacterium sp. cx-59 TaxID=2891207 RepID=UPI001E62A11C|nr:alpha/beta hydrolase [Microbacterium sp. cx-59]MCC4908772.1 alpha/beta hydrolase [Microbacterium sp. cx-59]